MTVDSTATAIDTDVQQDTDVTLTAQNCVIDRQTDRRHRA